MKFSLLKVSIHQQNYLLGIKDVVIKYKIKNKKYRALTNVVGLTYKLYIWH